MPKNAKKHKSSKKSKPKWYFDACALRKERKTIDEIRARHIRKDILISYLALGEAYGSCCSENKDVEQAFKELIEEIRKYILVIKNDISNKLFEDVRSKCDRISIADAIHLATALKYKCENLITADRDLYGLSKNTKKELCNKYGISNFTITKM